MQLPHAAHLLRIYVGASLQHGPLPVFEALMYRARTMNMAGVTILKNHIGFGHAETAGSHSLKMAADLPVVVELVDTPENIAAFIPVAKEMLHNRGLITLQETTVIHQGTWPEAENAPTA